MLRLIKRYIYICILLGVLANTWSVLEVQPPVLNASIFPTAKEEIEITDEEIDAEMSRQKNQEQKVYFYIIVVLNTERKESCLSIFAELQVFLASFMF